MPLKLMPIVDTVPAAPNTTLSLVVGRGVTPAVRFVQFRAVNHAVPAPLPPPTALAPLQPSSAARSAVGATNIAAHITVARRILMEFFIILLLMKGFMG